MTTLEKIADYPNLLQRSLDDYIAKQPPICRRWVLQTLQTSTHLKIRGDFSFNTRVMKWIKKIVHYPLGLACVWYFFQSGKELEIVQDTKNTQKGNTITINPDSTGYYYSKGASGLILSKWHKISILFHEWVHFNRRVLQQLCDNDINKLANIGPNFTNLEEQLTTCGLTLDAAGEILIFPECENGLNLSCGYPLRMNYSGIYMPRKMNPSIVDLVYAKAYNPLKEALTKTQVDINERYQIKVLNQLNHTLVDQTLKKKKVTALSLACLIEDLSIVTLLLDHHAWIDQKDDLDGPIEVAKKAKNPQIQDLICEKTHKRKECPDTSSSFHKRYQKAS